MDWKKRKINRKIQVDFHKNVTIGDKMEKYLYSLTTFGKKYYICTAFLKHKGSVKTLDL